MRECKLETFRRGFQLAERPTNTRELARMLGLSEVTTAKYIAVLEARGELRTKILGGMRLIL